MATKKAKRSSEGLPYCESCRSWHAKPKSAAHHKALQCFSPWEAKKRPEKPKKLNDDELAAAILAAWNDLTDFGPFPVTRARIEKPWEAVAALVRRLAREGKL